MVSNIPNHLGKLENVPIREVWKNEESVFTPWLMENIEVINELINLDIEGLERESNVGSYTADLIGKVAGTDNYVVIENQFGMSNHDHLGKLLTYISGKEAKIGIWISEEFREEHLSALNYLNESIRLDGLRLFAIKVEVKKIGDSPNAPYFSIIVRPNDFQKSLSTPEISPLDNSRLNFFEALVAKYKEIRPSWNKLKALPQSWLSFSAGKTGIAYSWAFKSIPVKKFTVELYIDMTDAEDNMELMARLKAHKDQIEERMGTNVEFQELEGKRATRIELSKKLTAATNKLSESEINKLVEWGANTMNKFQDTMSPLLGKVLSEGDF